MKRMFLLLFVLCFTNSFSVNALTNQEIIGKLEGLQGSIDVAPNDEEARIVLDNFRRQHLDIDLYMNAIAQTQAKMQSSCTCCPSCHNPNYKNPCDVACPTCACPWPGTFTRSCVAGMSMSEDPVYLCDPGYGHSRACTCAWWIMPFVEPCGYGYKTLSYPLNVAKAGGGMLINLIARMFPCFIRTQGFAGPTKATLLLRIQEWINHLKNLAEGAPAYSALAVSSQPKIPSAPPKQ